MNVIDVTVAEAGTGVMNVVLIMVHIALITSILVSIIFTLYTINNIIKIETRMLIATIPVIVIIAVEELMVKTKSQDDFKNHEVTIKISLTIPILGQTTTFISHTTLSLSFHTSSSNLIIQHTFRLLHRDMV